MSTPRYLELEARLKFHIDQLERENAKLRTALEHYIDMTTLAIPDDWNPAKMGGWPDINQLEKRDVGDVARVALGINDVVNERL